MLKGRRCSPPRSPEQLAEELELWQSVEDCMEADGPGQADYTPKVRSCTGTRHRRCCWMDANAGNSSGSSSLGQLAGGLMAWLVLDKLGRKWCLGIGGIMIELSTSLLIWSPSYGVVIAARVIEGISIGFLLLGWRH